MNVTMNLLPPWLTQRTLQVDYYITLWNDIQHSPWRLDLLNVYYAVTELYAVYIYLIETKSRRPLTLVLISLMCAGYSLGLFWHFKGESFDDSFFMQLTVFPAVLGIAEVFLCGGRDFKGMLPVVGVLSLIMVLDSGVERMPEHPSFHRNHAIIHVLIPTCALFVRNWLNGEHARAKLAGKND